MFDIKCSYDFIVAMTHDYTKWIKSHHIHVNVNDDEKITTDV